MNDEQRHIEVAVSRGTLARNVRRPRAQLRPARLCVAMNSRTDGYGPEALLATAVNAGAGSTGIHTGSGAALIRHRDPDLRPRATLTEKSPRGRSMKIRRGTRALFWVQALFALFLAAAAEAGAVSEADLVADIEQIEREIAEAEKDVSLFEDISTKSLYEHRLAVLRLSKALLDQRIRALRAGIPIDTSLPVTRPDPAQLPEILADIQRTRKNLAAAEAESAKIGGGLGKALAEKRVATARQTLAMLQLAYYRDRYGLHLRETLQQPPGEENGELADAQAAAERDIQALATEWADPRYPDIDYATLAFQALAQQNSTISGWWGIRESKAEIDDSPTVHAFNVSATEGAFFEPHLAVICQEGETKLLFQPGDILVDDGGTVRTEIRIDEEPPRSTSWSATTHGKSAGLFGKDAVEFLKDLKGAQTLYVRLTERYGERHDAKFILAGFEDVIASAAEACEWSTLSKRDFEAVQSALKSLGHYKGTVDGAWGKGSQRALNAWQEANGIPKTESLTAETATRLIGTAESK
jgi:hypothetical protein